MSRWVFMVLVLLGLTLIIGCSNGGITGSKPPKTVIMVGDKTYETMLGSYCWRSECVDTVGPLELLEGKEPVKIKPGEEVSIVMDYKPKPNEFYFGQIDDSKEIEVEIINNGFKAPAEKGIYYYVYSVWMMRKRTYLMAMHTTLLLWKWTNEYYMAKLI